MHRLIAFIGFLALLVLLAVVGDRFAAGYAADRAEQELAKQGFQGPEVVIRNFPFLTQLIDGEYRDVVVNADALTVEGIRSERITATLRGVSLDDTSAPQEVRARRLAGRATVPYSQVEKAADVPTLKIRRGRPGEVRLTGEIDVLGRKLLVGARGRIDARGDHLRVTPTAFEVEGVGDLDERISTLLTEQFSIDYPIPGLPRGLVVQSVTPGPTGFIIHATGRDTVLRAP